jgi:hypothetical protein
LTRKITGKTKVGLILTLLGLSLLSMALIPVTSAEEVINASFTVGAGNEYGPYDDGTYYHTRVLGKSVLEGEVNVSGEGIYLTANGYNTQQFKDLHVTGSYNFIIDPADDLYTFTFNNTRGQNECLVQFTLKEVWTRSMMIGSPPLFIAWLSGFILLPIGVVVIAVAYPRSRTSSLCPSTKTLW